MRSKLGHIVIRYVAQEQNFELMAHGTVFGLKHIGNPQQPQRAHDSANLLGAFPDHAIGHRLSGLLFATGQGEVLRHV